MVFADEPTGALDQSTGHDVMRILVETTKAAGASLVVVTHDEHVAAWCDRRIEVRDGLVVGECGAGPMNAVLALAPRFQRAGGRDSRVTTALAITAFAVSTGLTLGVVGGLLGFISRADEPVAPGATDIRSFYEILAWFAVVLLVVPLVTLGGSAARLGVARRDARLATLRLLGATSREVVGLTLVETAWQGLVGAVLGIVLYGLLLPLIALLPFQGTTFTVGELWVGWQGLLAALVAVPILAAASGAFSLRRVAISPLGVARRTAPRGLRFVRLLVALAGIGLFMVVSAVGGALGAAAIAALVGALAVGFATLNAVGPWVLGLVGKVQLRRATTPARLLAARRLLDDPRAAWRVVGGLGLAGFVAGVLAVDPVADQRGHLDGPAGRDAAGRPGHRCAGHARRRVPARCRVGGDRAGGRRARPSS